MSRNFLSALGIGMVATLIIAAIVLGVEVVMRILFFGGISDIASGLTAPGDGVEIIKGITKVICSGPVALLFILAINLCREMIDRLCAWRVGRG